jgi:drug/metabolite transporter (DMT)-like permease
LAGPSGDARPRAVRRASARPISSERLSTAEDKALLERLVTLESGWALLPGALGGLPRALAPPAAVPAPPAPTELLVLSESEGEDEEGAESTSGSGDVFALPAPLAALAARIPRRARGLLLLNGLVVLVASNWVIVKQTGATFDPFDFAALRFAIAAAALSPLLARAARSPRVVRAGVELGLLTAAGYLTQAEGLLTTDASRASFISTFTCLVVPFLAGASGRPVGRVTWAAAAAAVAGVSLLERSGAPPCWGDAWAMISAIAFGVQMYRTEHWSRRLGKRALLPLMATVLATTAGVAGLAALATHPDAPAALAAAAQAAAVAPAAALAAAAEGAKQLPWGAALYTGLLSTDVALLLEVVALRDVSSADAAIVYALEPVLGAGLAFAVLGERWGPSGWAGAALIVGSSVAAQLYGADAAPAAAPAVAPPPPPASLDE